MANETQRGREEMEFLKSSKLYQEYEEQRQEVLRHKWLESEKAGHDIGFEQAFFDWLLRHRRNWRRRRRPART
jgi:hypothetical protein